MVSTTRSIVTGVALALVCALPLQLLAQQTDSVTLIPPASLIADGLPSIPASLPSDVRRYTESRSATLADWHPHRRAMLISTRFGNTPQLHFVAFPLGARTQVTFFDEPVNGAKYEPRMGRYFLFFRDVGGNEFHQLYRHDQDGKVTLLTDGKRSRNAGFVFSNRGDRIAYTSTRRNGTDGDVYVMDPLRPSGDRLLLQVTGGNGWSVDDWSSDDKQLLVGEGLSVNQSRLHIVDVASGKSTQLSPATSDNVVFESGKFSRDGKGVYLITDAGAEFRRLAYMDLSSHSLKPLTSSNNWDVEEFELSHDGGTIAFVTNEAGTSRLHLLNTRSGKIRGIGNAPSGVISGLSWRPGSNELGFSVASARSPSDLYSFDAASGRVSRWTESELGGLVAADLVEPSLIKWRSFDNREISGFYYRPPARFQGKRPVIINIHGGPEGQSRPGFLGRNNYFLSELGVAIIYPNVRGSTGYGKSFVRLDNGALRLESVRDIGALLDWIATNSELDATRVLVTGGSYGGYMTLAVATMFNDRICCSLDVVGISNFNTFLKNTEGYRRDLRRAEYGDERDPAMRDFFERTAPLNNAASIKKPLFVVQGANDPRVPRTEAEQMVARVKQNGNQVWYLVGRDEGHGFRKKANVDFQFYSTVMFIRRYLLGDR